MKIESKRMSNENNNQSVLTQEEAHEVFQLPEYDIVSKYVLITSTMLFTVFYHSVLPLGTCFTIVFLVITYLIDKVHPFTYC